MRQAQVLKNAINKVARWVLEREVVRAAIESSQIAPSQVPPGFHSATPPELPRSKSDAAPQAAFITARFRSGSTLLWKLLREHEALTAYYEPLNPRRWFDPSVRGQRVDRTHAGVSQYWEEYAHVKHDQVPWEEWWAAKDLYLPSTVPAHNLHRYLQLLIEKAPDFPVLQFNRLDFRLAWVASRFPNTAIVHLYRNPRDQWLSTFLNQKPVPTTATVADFARSDEFYLIAWAADLRRRIPLLAEVEQLHPYELSYLISRLSFVFASNYAAHSISYESLATEPKATLKDLGNVLMLDGLDQVPGIADVSKRSVGRWNRYADASWFEECEARCDELIDRFVLSAGPST